MKAEGKWTWWNQYGNMSVQACIDRTVGSGLEGVIVKANYPHTIQRFKSAGVRVGAENYTYPERPETEGVALANAISAGCEFAVINAEAEWEGDTLAGSKMRRLIASFRDRHPDTELYASVDTRGGRINMPHQRVLGEHITGWMPMIYPLAFRDHRPPGYIQTAFGDCLDRGQDFQGKPVLPTLQTYDGIGPLDIDRMLAEVRRRGLKGYQAYTIGHATAAEWSVIASDDTFKASPPVPDPDWLEERIIGLDGRPVIFKVLQADLSTRNTALSRKEWITLSALGLIVGTHTHKITID